jgi:hypothetical protein
VDGEGSFLKIALELETGCLNETLVFRIVADRGQFFARVRSPYPAEIYVDKSVAPRQQTSGFGRSTLAELYGENQRRGDQQDHQDDGESAPNSHGMRSGMI